MSIMNINEQYQRTAGPTQRLINLTHLLSIGVIGVEKFCLRNCVCMFTQVSLALKTISSRIEKEKHSQIWQDTCEEDVSE